jgi:pyruvate/2-oxoglutarate dehydrogenase complex dihydrolipoamide acyltransferase (E2) component
MRQKIGEHMRRSLDTAAHCTTIVEADMSGIEAKRGKLSYLPLVARSVIEALREYPALNATLEGETFTTYEGVHLGIAVSLDEAGLIVPVLEDAPAPKAKPEAEPAAPVASGQGEPLSIMRQKIGEHMRRSLDTAAHCTTIVEADMAGIEAKRGKLSYLPFVARSVIEALREYPLMNATLQGDRITVHEEVNLGIAVSLGEKGLIVPVVHGAHLLSHEGLAAKIKDLAARARSGELKPEEVQGGTFTITNPGRYGALLATPIINQPQVAILDLEAVVKRPVVVGGDSIAIRPMTYLCMSWDHRALDGAYAAQFLSEVRSRIEAWT